MKFKNFILTFMFFILMAFTSGIIFLFFVNVPVESLLAKQGISQVYIDSIMGMLILLWFMIAVLMTILYYFYWVITSRRIAYVTLIVFAAISLMFIKTLIEDDNEALKVFRAEVKKASNNYTIGPYPKEADLVKLKAEGYDGVITLLNPLIPFENILLKEEFEHGRKIGIKVLSFPMLPWVSDNNSVLNEIKKVTSQNPGRYYIHCYLGKHRANLVNKILTGGKKEVKNVINLPASFERGKLQFYKNNRIVLGPFPTDEEWFGFIFISDVHTVVSYLDPKNPANKEFIEKEKRISSEMGLTYKSFPISDENINTQLLSDIVSYALQAPGKVYIHGFKADNISVLLDTYLKQETISH